ncbi:hypothetical protein D9757_011365 [Collybiopsis confluens]|uniref:Uncharacterized protein n=1 Tax=Collybiopsis confluens TaxID=2823264 RepID=A0A8H5LL77_9AGAR|nr:hypothetical protein D9757_011365 [Collybiopsis confluens]
MSPPHQLFRDAHGFIIQGGSFYSGGPPPTPPNPPPAPPNPTPCDEIDAYLRFLLPKRLGYPLWSPKPGNWLPPAYREHGVCIGDVGFPTEHGSFSYQFNVGLPPNDALNVGRVPRDFIQLEGVHDSENWMWSDDGLGPGGFIASNHAHFRKRTIPPGPRYVPIAPPEVGAGLSFDTTASRGALLILPEGGVRYNHQQKMIFFEHATRYAKSWFNHINHVLHQGVNEIYLITGCDKTRAWGVASFLGARDPRDVYLEYVPQAPVTPGRRPSYRFRRHDSASASAGVDDFFENQSGCTFLRGYKITIREDEEGQNPDITHYTEWGGSGGGGGGGRGGGGGKPHPPGPSGGRGVSKRRKSYRAEYHPSSTMNKWVLKMHQDIDIAITHDDDWTDLIDEKDGEIPDDKELIQRLSSRKQLCRLSHGGYTFAYFRNASEVQIKDVRSIVAPPLSKQGSTSNIGAGVSSVVGTVNTLVSILERGFMGPGDTGERAATIIRECREFIQKASINDKHYLMEAEDIFYEQMEDSLNAAARNKERLQHLATLDRKREPEYIQWANVSRTIESLLSDLTRLRKKLVSGQIRFVKKKPKQAPAQQLASDTNHGSPISPKTHQFATVSGSYTAPQVVRNTSGGSTVYNSGLQGGGYAMNPSYPVPVAATTSANWSHTSTSGSTSHRTSGTYPYVSSERRLSSTSLGGTGHARNASLDNLSISGTNRDPGFSSRILSKIKSPFKSSDNTSASRMAGGNIPSARNSATDLSTSPRATRRDSFTKQNAEGGSHTGSGSRTHRSSSRSRHDPSERSSMYDSVSGSMESLRINPEDRRHSSYSNTTTTPQTFPAPSQSLTTTEMYEQKRLERSKKHRPKKDGR